ncbi:MULTISPECIES: hypothetical protein [Flavobacterium]|uniref:hypothetical protein n=1 Tax=Flavobacterium TaxID=237 RepID=UPI001FCC61E0|nr:MULTISPECIES: hypothetical protein [Flavobacterium]UOK41475.1 hypothetical protein LZF87_09110 [Flavobacterium enshiense]
MIPVSSFQPKKDAFKNTFCIFREVPLSEIEQLEERFKSESGSAYYYTVEGMYRLSNHWGRLANSKWRLLAMDPPTSSKIKLGFAKWEDFYPDNATEKNYYIEADFENQTANYFHKNCPDYNGINILRTTAETRKRLKNIRNILTLTQWATHYYQDIKELRKRIVYELINTDKTLEVIKREVTDSFPT